VLLNDEDFHFVTWEPKQWWTGSLQTKQFRHLGTIADGEPDYVGVSSHYGVVISLQGRLQRVVVTPKRVATLEHSPFRVRFDRGTESTDSMERRKKSATSRGRNDGKRSKPRR